MSAAPSDLTVRATASPRAASNGWWGMLLLVATEATLFAVFIASYFYLRFKTEGGWPPDEINDPKLTRPLIMTAGLLSSSVPMYLAESGIRRGNQRRLKWGLAISFLLGAGFLTLQGWEYAQTEKEFTPRTNAYGSLFYTITGAHGPHVLAGLVLLGWTLSRAVRGAFSIRRHLAVQVTALYWHFVVGLWLVILLSVYLSPRL
jgi:heme/copper-type cytochrome/quinol oxidase subunit 3